MRGSRLFLIGRRTPHMRIIHAFNRRRRAEQMINNGAQHGHTESQLNSASFLTRRPYLLNFIINTILFTLLALYLSLMIKPVDSHAANLLSKPPLIQTRYLFMVLIFYVVSIMLSFSMIYIQNIIRKKKIS